MKEIRRCPVILSLAVSGMLLALIGIIGKGSVYKEYELNLIKKPFLALPLEGISKDVALWEVFGIRTGAGLSVGSFAEADGEGQSIGDLADADGGQVLEGLEETIGGEASSQLSEAAERMEQDGKAKGENPSQITQQFETVPESYFNDAVFIGDSRTVGLFEYGGMEERADFFAKISLTIYDVFTEKVARDGETGEKITVEEALAKKQYGKVYLMLGINELGTGTTESFMERYREVVATLRRLQPDAVIFVQGIMRVTGEKNEKDPIFNNTNINERNEEIARLANGEDIFYIDVNEVVCDEEGNLNEQYTTDEIHLKAKYYEIWKQFLMEHGVVKNKN